MYYKEKAFLIFFIMKADQKGFFLTCFHGCHKLKIVTISIKMEKTK